MRHRSPARNLRIAVDCLPVETRRAMLDGIEANRIIVGAYTDRQGGVCPMLAAHRRGGRTSLVSFARAWDRYTGARGKPRPASEREVNTILKAANAFDDHVTLRREPVNHRLLARESDCSKYWKLTARPDDEVRALLVAWRVRRRSAPQERAAVVQ